MENTKIGNKEAIALLVTIVFNHIIMNITKSIIDTTSSASLLNILYIGIITIIFTCIICYFLNKYFTFRSRTDTPRQALRFALNIAVCYLIAYGLAKPLTLRLLSGVSVTARDNVAMLVGMVLFSLLNYLGQRVLVFKKD